MFKFVIFCACVSVALAAPGLLAEHHTIVEEPILQKIGSVVRSDPSAVSHQSFTQVHSKAVVAPVVAPVVKTTVHTVEPALSVVKAIETPVVHAYHDASVVSVAPVAPVAPVLKAVHTPVLRHAAVIQQSHHQLQLHSGAALVSPVVKSVVAPVVHAAPLTHVIHH